MVGVPCQQIDASQARGDVKLADRLSEEKKY